MPGLKGFFLRVLLWLPAAFAAWYYLSILHVTPIAWLSDIALAGFFPEAFAGVEQHGNRVEVATRLGVELLRAGVAPSGATIAFDLNPLIYGYGLPLVTGLILASPGELESKVFRIVVGGLVLLPVQAWGVSFDALKTLYFSLGPEVARAAKNAVGLAPDAVVLAYQFGFLILPAVTPILVWVAMNTRYLRTLAPRLSESSSDSNAGA